MGLAEQIEKEAGDRVNYRVSVHGFHCSDCREFVHTGYDGRDKKDFINAVCLECGDSYEEN